jgi:hypothetical protein
MLRGLLHGRLGAQSRWARMPLSTTGLHATWSDIVWGDVGVLAMLLFAWVTLCLIFRVLLE